jgi:hypothetical protein
MESCKDVNVMKRLTLRFGIKRRRRVTNELLRQREQQDEARREYERQAELRPAAEELVPSICGCDHEWLREMAILWEVPCPF